MKYESAVMELRVKHTQRFWLSSKKLIDQSVMPNIFLFDFDSCTSIEKQCRDLICCWERLCERSQTC